MMARGGKKARTPSDDRNGAADLEQLMPSLRFPLSTIHVAVDGSRFLGLLFCFPSGHCVLEGGKERDRRLNICLLNPRQCSKRGQEMFCSFGGGGSLSFIQRQIEPSARARMPLCIHLIVCMHL